MQQFLNTSHHQWAILINGKKVRLLRDFYHSITKGFLEFDLESIFETANSEQFRVLFRILHRSRLENQYQGKQEIEYDEEGNPIEVEDNCLLESFHKKSRETGVKVGNKLRDQVIEAIEKLGNGFAESLDPDEFQNGKVKGFYAEILNIIYRLLFLMFAEQKGWLPVRNSIYARTYSLNALREMAERGNYSHDEEHDLWEGLKITFKLVANGYEFKNGDKINAFGGQLFSDKKIAIIKDLPLKNKFLLDAIDRLSYFKLDNLNNRINYANLAIDELGSVYESLLDYEPKLAKESTTLNKTELRRGEFYLDDRGTDRKTTGSYYTDSRLVAQLIESALVPVINNALAEKNSIEEKEKALLDLKVADIACGSGAFICAALEKMGEQLALIRMGDEERPTEDQLREAKRDVLLNCIYGVDLNPMALELAKFSLWITASLPDMPLSFLDHKLKCGNSLIGATTELIKKGIPEEAYKPVGNDNPAICTELKKKVRREQESLSRVNEPTIQYGLQFKRNEIDELLRLREVLNNRKQEEVADVDLAEEEYHQLEKMERKFKDWLMADVWTAAFFIEKTELDQTLYPTNVTLENLRENQPVNEVLINRVLKTADQYNFFHFHLEFPEVFEKGGFDCLLGNPPWERIKLQEKEFFASYDKSIATAKRQTERQRLIANIQKSNPILFKHFEDEKRKADSETQFLRESGKFKLSAIGDINTYGLFVESFYQLISSVGFCSIICPTGVATKSNTQYLFKELLENTNLICFYDFTNQKQIFRGVDSNFKFCLLSFSKSKIKTKTKIAFFLKEVEELSVPENIFSIEPSIIQKFNPNSNTLPLFRSAKDLSINSKIYGSLSVMQNTAVNSCVWEVSFKGGFHMTNEEHKFKTHSDLIEDETYLPLYEGKMIDIFNYRYADAGEPQGGMGIRGSSEKLSNDELIDINREAIPRFYVRIDDVLQKYNEEKINYVLAFRKIGGNVSNIRTGIFSIIPYPSIGDSLISIYKPGCKYSDILLHCSNLNSFVFDYLLRNKLSDTNITKFTLQQIPVVDFSKIEKLSHNSKLLKDLINEDCLQLTFNSNSHLELAKDFTDRVEPFIWNEAERFKIKCRLDAIYAHLYGLEKEEMDYILETFPIVKRKDIAKYGSYRTKETILQLYDEFVWVREEMEHKKQEHE
ncbi:MAG: hypothetical protein Q8S18_07980 [Bacteroidales bacterium]|nr:hypothetical protein [Bacteroidales bacterium]